MKLPARADEINASSAVIVLEALQSEESRPKCVLLRHWDQGSAGGITNGHGFLPLGPKTSSLCQVPPLRGSLFLLVTFASSLQLM